MVMVITKMDLLYKATVDPSEAEKLAESLGWHLVKTSVKENINVDKVDFNGWEVEYDTSKLCRFFIISLVFISKKCTLGM